MDTDANGDEEVRLRHARSFRADMSAYSRGRPGYPDGAVDWLLPPQARDVVDLGAGGGQLTRSLVARGLAVTAVEPSPAMRAQFAAALPGVPVVDGSGERIPLPDADADAVLCAQAWHWVEPSAASAEVVRVLRPGGVLGLVWNLRDEQSAFGAELADLLGSGGAVERIEPAPDVRAGLVPVRGPDTVWTQHLAVDSFVDLVGSRSYVLVLDQPDRAAVLARARDLGTRWAASTASGSIEVRYRTEVWRAVRP